ncbi:MAG: hypothetical protein ABIO44_09055, partial [Saprospiraceae bacterium]
MNIKYWWWKVLCVLLFVYVFTLGLLTPLKSGIEDIQPSRAHVGEQLNLEIKGYNTHFTKSKNTVFLKNEDAYYIQSSEVIANSDNDLSVSFILPAFLPSKVGLAQFSVLVSSSYDGTSI